MGRSQSSVKVPLKAAETPEAEAAGTLALSLIREALTKGARRLHLQPTADGRLDVRMRTPDGLGAGPCPPISAAVAPLVVKRLKMAAHLDPEERHRPQEGHMTIQRVPEGPVALRVNTLPTTHGEALVVEMLEPAQALTLAALGLDPSDLARLRDALDAPKGLVLAVGPRGSGKRTFLHACLRHVVADSNRTVFSIEEGRPADVPGTISVPIRHELGQFAGNLLNFVANRCDADVVHVGEVLQTYAGDHVVEYAAKGHLILGGLPTDDAITAVTRLLDLAIEPYLIAAGLTAVVACRTLHVLCPACRVPAPAPDPEDLRRLVPRLFEEQILDGWEQSFAARRGGCGACNGRGHRGRVGVYEVVDRPAEIIDALMRSKEGLGTRTLRARLHERTRTLRESALLRAHAGHVSIIEAVNATPAAPGGAPPRPTF